jgi:HD-GYP domain-containing protein (c-di-GMP phosphodiesterase class II)
MSPQGRPLERQKGESGLTQRELINILFRYHAVIKVARVYDFNNQIVQEQIQHLYEALTAVLEREGEIVLRRRENSIYVNGVRAKFDYSNYHIYKFLSGEFEAKEIAAISISQGVPADEVHRFIKILLRRDLPAESPYAEIIQAIDAGHIDHIIVEKVSPAELQVSREKSAVRMYFAGIYLLKDVFEKQKKGGSFNLNLAKRWMQSIFNQIVDDESFMYGLTNIKNYDDYTLNHSINVCILAIALGRRLGLTREEISDLGVSAFLHDLGKLEVPKEILDKPAGLSAEERTIVEGHVYHGAEKLIELKSARRLPLRSVQVALEHHLNVDLSGYPKYVKKKTVSLFSKIVKIVDYFDAITTKRVYRPGVFTREEALGMMKKKSGDEFEPVLLKVFVAMIGAHPIGSLVVLDSGEIGIVFETNPHPAFQLRPRVKIIINPDRKLVDGAVVDLSEIEPATARFRRSIVKSLDAEKYGIRVADYFLAKAV